MNGFTLGQAILYLRGDRSGLDTELGAAERSAQGWAGRLGSNLKGFVGTALLGVGTVAAGAIIGAGTAAIDVSSQVKQIQNDLQAQLGVTADTAKELGDVAVNVWKNNWGGSLEEVGAVIGDIQQRFSDMGGLGDRVTEQLAAGAFAISDTFGVETSETIAAVHTLMDQFGIDAQTALDFVTKGFQNGLNSSDDFLDSIGEYSNLFADGGADVAEFFSVMESGLQGGVLGTDKAADAFKEFGIRIVDGSDTTKDALKGIGLNYDEITEKITSGELTKAQAFELVLDKLNDVDDVALQTQLGVALIGTQFEDLGNAAALGITTANTKLEDFAGATDSLNAKYDNWGSMWESIKRSALASLIPVGDTLLGLANEVMPYVQQGFAWLTEVLPPLMQNVANGIRVAVTIIKGLFSGELVGSLMETNSTFAAVVGFVQAAMATIQNVITVALSIVMEFWRQNGADIIATVQNMAAIVGEIISGLMALYKALVLPAIQAVAGFIAAHKEEIVGYFTGLWEVVKGIITAALTLVQGIIKTALALIKGDWEGAWNALKEMFSSILDSLKGVAEGAMKMLKSAFEIGADAVIAVVEGIGRDIVNGIKSGVSAAWGSFMSWLNEKLASIPEPIRQALGIGSPSRVMAEQVGIPIVQGIMAGILEMLPDLESLLAGVTEDIVDQLATLKEKAEDLMADLAEGVLRGGADLARTKSDILFTADEFAAETAEMIAKAQEAGVELTSFELGNLEVVNDAVRGQLEDAQAEADRIAATDPERAAAYLELKRKQIMEYAEIQRDINLAADQEERERLIQRQNLIMEAQAKEMELFEQQQNQQDEDQRSQYQEVADAISAILDSITDTGENPVFTTTMMQLYNLLVAISAVARGDDPGQYFPGGNIPGVPGGGGQGLMAGGGRGLGGDTFHIDARGSNWTEAQLRTIFTRVLDERARMASNRIRT